MTLPLAAPEKLLKFLGANPDSDHLHRYRAALIVASRQIEQFCGREFSRKHHTEFLTPFVQSGRRIPLKGFPFVASEPHSVKLNGAEMSPSEYRFEEGSLILKIRTSAESGSLEVEYVAGYPTVIPTKDENGIQIPDTENAYTDAPEDLSTACILQALTIERTTAQPNLGLDGIQSDAAVSPRKFALIHGFEASAYRIVTAYRRPPFFGRG